MGTQRQRKTAGINALTHEDFGFGQLFWDIRDAVIVGDAETDRIVLWNPAAQALFGFSPDEAIGLPIEALMPEALRGLHHAGMLRYFQTGKGELIDAQLPIEVPALRRTGESITIELQLTPIVAGRVPGRFVLATVRDVTARKQGELDRLHLAEERAARVAAEQAAEALRRSEARFRTAFDSAPIGMDLVAIDGRFLQVNAAWCEMTGYSNVELLDLTFVDLTHPDDLEKDLAKFSRLLAGNIPTVQMEKRYVRKDGTVFWARINSSLVPDHDGSPLYFISQIEDITAQVQAEEKLRSALEQAQAANQAKGVFLDMMSHELRTPLQATLGYSEFLLADPTASLTNEQREDIDAIHEAGVRMITLINQLLELSRTDAGRLNLAHEPVDLNLVMEQVRQDVAPQVAEKRLRLHIDIPDASLAVKGDPEGVRQILLNLVSNAVKFTPAGTINVTAGVTNTGVMEIVVSDTGIGISPDVLPHIFEEFYQENTRLSRPPGSAGLGLAIAHKLAAQMGGSISVTSEPNVGSTFRVHLPVWER